MITLEVNAENIEELQLYWEKLGKLIEEGYTGGTLMDGWQITEGDE